MTDTVTGQLRWVAILSVGTIASAFKTEPEARAALESAARAEIEAE